MIQSIQASAQSVPVQAPKTVNHASPLPTQIQAESLNSDKIQIQSKAFTEAEARTALQNLSAKYGSIRKPGLFKNPKIDLNEAIDRLKNGKDIMFYNQNVGDLRDRVDSYDELMLLDALQGSKQNHGVSQPELRLPLLFLEGQKLEEYNGEERLDAFNAYRLLKKDWRISINGQAVKPKDLVNHVIAKGWTESLDPGQKMRSAFTRLPESGWRIQGQDASRELAYLSWIAGDRPLELDGVSIATQADFDLAMNLIAGENNLAIDAELGARLKGMDLRKFTSPVTNLYSVYQRLNQGTALTYSGSTLHNLDEAVIFDALAGSRKPTQLLPANLQTALQYLSQGHGLSTANGFDAWQNLKAGNSVSYTFNGGPTQEPIRFEARSLDQAIQMHSKVVAQRQQDQLRPELNQARQIMHDRLPGLQDSLSNQLDQTRRAVERAKADIPVQETRLTEAQNDYRRIKPQHDQALAVYQEAERTVNSAERRYNADKRDYDWELSKYQRIERDFHAAERNANSAQRSAQAYENKARDSDAKAKSDPANAAAHQRNAAQFRQQAQQARQQAQNYSSQAQRLRGDLDRQRWDLQRAERNMNSSRRDLYDARSHMDGKKSLWQDQVSRLNNASSRQRNAENQLRMAQQTVADGSEIEQVIADSTRQISNLQGGFSKLGSYTDYQQQRQSLHQAAGRLNQLFDSNTYQRVHGSGLSQRFAPLMTLLNNMDKPAS